MTIKKDKPSAYEDILIYLIKGAIAGLILSFTTYSAHLFTEVTKEDKAIAAISQATVKVEHYKELKAVATTPEKEIVFNEKHGLNYKLAIDEQESAKAAKTLTSTVLDLVTVISRLLASCSGAILLIAFLLWWTRPSNSQKVKKNTREFTLKNNELDIVINLLNEKINMITSNKKMSPETVADHKALLGIMQKKFKPK